ncbi:MAG: lamin tail domain-containing protein, partial [Bacteroidales bacterium]|nr:lamin tail domain-containing protein [Bacteroidales bacterium]
MRRCTLIRRTIVFFFLASILAVSANLYGQLLLNEMMALNASTLEDQFNGFPDWIEIYNAGETAIDLNNYWLSDDSTNLKQWNIPPTSLSAGSYQIIFASGKDISTGLTYWHTAINAGDEWRCVIPTGPIDDKWKTSTSESSAWRTGNSGFGYSDDDDATVLPQTISFYLQKEFQLESVDQLIDAALYIDYDDGFVAYLNGTEIARSSNMGDSGQVVNFDAPAGGNREATMYSGSPPESYFFSQRTDLLKEGSNILAVEVHNVSTNSSDMSGIPFLLLGFTGIQENLMYKNPYFSVKESFPHTNFKIQSGGESLFLSDSDGNIVDKIANVLLPTDYSYGRTMPDTQKFGLFESPTPGSANVTPYFADYFTDSVTIVLHNNEFDVLQQVHVESKLESVVIRFSTDGTEPNEQD